VASAPAPSESESEVVNFLAGLRQYRGTLPGSAQALLDSLVAAGLGRSLYQPPEEEIKRLWCAYASGPHVGQNSLGGPYGADAPTWETTPWGLACRARYW
jgi:hypothetical protein